MLNSRLARKVRNSPALRPLGIAGYRLYTRLGPPRTGPRVLANSIPKAGTHVLMSLLDAIPAIQFSGIHFSFSGAGRPGGSHEESLAELRKVIRQLRSGQYMTGHIRHQEDISAVLSAVGCRTILSIRDPRAIALSAANFMHAHPRHPLYARSLSEFPNLDDRIRAVITGVPQRDNSPALPSLAERLDRFVPWLDEPGVCVVRYEDLIGAQGGGSARRQRMLVTDILRFLELAGRSAEVDRVAESIFSTTSATFRSGQIDSWREEMPSRFVELINERCEQQMRRMGYPPA